MERMKEAMQTGAVTADCFHSFAQVWAAKHAPLPSSLPYSWSCNALPCLPLQVIKHEVATVVIPELEFEILGSGNPCTGLTVRRAYSLKKTMAIRILPLWPHPRCSWSLTAALLSFFPSAGTRRRCDKCWRLPSPT